MSKVQTIQQTGKLWKLAQMLGALGIIGGVGVLVAQGQGFVDDKTAVWSWLAIVGGLGLWVSGRLGAWWFHG